MIKVLHKSIMLLTERRFTFGKNAHSALRSSVGDKDLCSNNKRSYAFFGVLFRCWNSTLFICADIARTRMSFSVTNSLNIYHAQEENNMKKALCITLVYAILMTLLVIAPITANANEKSMAVTGASSGTTGECTWVLDGTELTISGNGAMADYSFSTIISLPWGTSITKVTIDEGVTSIGNSAFYYCSRLMSVTIPDSVTSIGNSAFYGCNNLTSVKIGNSVRSISDYAFYRCDWLMSVTIPDSVKSIGSSAFSECTSLISVTIPDSVTSIGVHAFDGTAWFNNQPDGLVYAGKVAYKIKGICPTEVTIKDGTKGIADSAFYDCALLTRVTIPDSVTSISDSAFYNCTGLISVMIGNSVTSIGVNAFCGCTGLTSLTIPDSVTSIDVQAFYRCTGLTSLTIPDSVTSIGGNAFYSCTGLKSVTIGNSVTSIGKRAFSGCNNLTCVVLNQFAVNKFIDVFSKSNSITNVIISNSVTSIGNSAFYECNNLTSVTIPDSVTSIGSSAFYSCNGLTNITIPDSVEMIGAYAFYGTSLTSVTIPASVTDIYEKAFGYYNKEGFGESKVKDFTIYGYKNSEAQRYANNNNFIFVALDEPTEPEDKPIKGDIDGDGEVTIIDTTYIQRYLAGLQTPDLGIGEPLT